MHQSSDIGMEDAHMLQVDGGHSTPPYEESDVNMSMDEELPVVTRPKVRITANVTSARNPTEADPYAHLTPAVREGLKQRLDQFNKDQRCQ